MQLKMGTDHAIRIILYIAASQTGIVTCAEICERMHISSNYIYVTVARLRKAGLIATTQGAAGGCYLMRLPKDITLYDIIAAMEGTICISQCLESGQDCPNDVFDICPLRKVYQSFQGSMEAFFRQVTIDDLMNASFASESKLPGIEWDSSTLSVQNGTMKAEDKLARLNYAFEMMPLEIREHCTRTSLLAPVFCQQILEKSAGTELFREMVPVVGRISICARFHDIGMHKMLMRNKEEALSDSINGYEYRYHPLLGMDFIKLIGGSTQPKDPNEESWWRQMMDGALCHHENWDGSGYPAGIAGKKIPLIARIMAMINDYDHMRQDGLSKEEIEEQMRASGGTKYDPELTEIMFA